MGLTNFPVQLTSFIGREREIADVKHPLFDSHLVTLTGASGSGKTRLAFQIANSVSENFADGMWLVFGQHITVSSLRGQQGEKG